VAPTTVNVVVATQDIAPYKTISSEMIELREMSSAATPDGALTAPGQAVGQIAQVQIASGQPITRGQVTARTAAQGLTFVIPEGLRAVTVALDAISGVGGFVYPGDHVDVLTTLQQGEVTLTRTIVQNVEVLAMNDLTSRPSASRGQQQATDQEGATGTQAESGAPAAEQVKSATLAVTPDQAQAIILSAFKGAVHLVLRPREEEAIVSLQSTSDYGLMGLSAPADGKPAEGEEEVATGPMVTPMGWPAGMAQPPGVSAPGAAPAAAAPAAPAAPTVEVIRGTDREVVTPQQ